MNRIQSSPVELARTGAMPLVFAVTPRDRSFWVGLAAAALVHGLVLFGLGEAAVRTIGDPNGHTGAINVDLVDEADLLRSLGSAAAPGESEPVETPTAPAGAASPATAAAPPSVEPSPDPAQPQEPVLKKTLADTVPDEPAPQKAPVPAEIAPQALTNTPTKTLTQEPPAQPKPAMPIDDKDLADLLSLKLAQPHPPQKVASADPSATRTPSDVPAPDKSASSKPTHKASPKVDLSLPASAAPGNFSGRSAAFSRPEGITRSGENDEFARGVIRALRQTMPEARGRLSRLVVRIELNGKGNLAAARVVTTSGDPTLDQDVLFSIKQSNFPIPAGNLKPVDWIFVVTYIYN